MVSEGEPRKTFIAMVKELQALAEAMELGLQADIVEANLKILALSQDINLCKPPSFFTI